MRALIGTEVGLLDLDRREAGLDRPVALARGPAGWWAVTEGYRIWTSSDARSWEEATTIRGLRANCVLHDDGGALLGTSEAHLVRVTGRTSERVRSFDSIKTRDDWYTPWGGPADVRSLSAGPDGIRYANVHVGGIVRSEDGARWHPTAIDIDSDVHQVLAHPARSGTAYAATAVGLATTLDGGMSWDFADEGMHAAYCRAVAIAGDTLLVSASKSHTGRQSALYQRPIDGGEFERCEKGLPEWFADNVDTYCLDARGEDAVLGTTDGRVFVSEDAGRTWDEAWSGEGPVTCVSLDPRG